MAERRRQMGAFDRLLENFAKSKLGGWWFIQIAPHLDRPLMALSRGRISTNVGQPICVLVNRGAKSGKEYRTPLLYATDGDNLVLTASKAGAVKHPGWYHNLKANPDVEVQYRGRTEPRRAREAEGAEYDRLWAEVNDLYAGYSTYQQRAGARRIPVIVLEPR
jgi:deazaflavin-dependent oxidoreductase (nitroreductase family)